MLSGSQQPGYAEAGGCYGLIEIVSKNWIHAQNRSVVHENPAQLLSGVMCLFNVPLKPVQ